jgi:hypothetical protein
MKYETTKDGRPNYCLHDHHPDPAVEAKARELFMAENARRGGWWELVETPESWWDKALKEINNG